MFQTNDPLSTLPSLSTAAASLPVRVRKLLEQLQSLLKAELGRELERLLDTLEQDLFRQAEQSRNSGTQSGYLKALGLLRSQRDMVAPRFMAELATALTGLREPRQPEATVETGPDFGGMRLVDHSEVTETNVLTAIARRHESRAGLPLLLLGQRFGVMAGQPAFESSRLPVGPHSLAQMLSKACEGVTSDVDTRLKLYQLFDSQLMAGYMTLVEAMNALLEAANVLPGLTFIPSQTRRSEGRRGTPGQAGNPAGNDADFDDNTTDADAHGYTGGGPARRHPAQGGPTSMGSSDEVPPQRFGTASTRVDTVEEMQALSQLQQLLATRRGLEDMQATASSTLDQPLIALATAEVDAALSGLQSRSDALQGLRNPGQIRQTLLDQSLQQHGQAASLSHQDNETFELLDLLYNEIGRELRQGTRGAALLERLQVPLLRVALQDRGFFVRQQHPARQLLNAVAEAGTQWLDNGDGEADPRLDQQLGRAVDHIVEHYDGDAEVFASAHRALGSHLEEMARKAEIAEKRQVDAARGRDKLELAKLQAAKSIRTAIGPTPIPRFLTTLLEQAWTDVLSLILLRHGEGSDEWRQHLDATSQIIAANRGTAAPESLQPQLQEALGLVGYQGEEAASIAKRLAAVEDESDDAATRTELALKLKARARLGASEAPPPPPAAPRNAREEECYKHLRSLPFGSWIEFKVNQQGDLLRRRLAWFSPVTGRALLVNQKGQRADEGSGRDNLDQLARLLAIGEARIVDRNERGSLVDRAWQATMGTLRGLARRNEQEVLQ